MSNASRRRSEAAALAGAAVTGLIAFTLFLAGALLLWANAHYKDPGGYLASVRNPVFKMLKAACELKLK